MKNIFKIAILGLLISFTSCSDSEVLIDQVYDTVDSETGVVVRTVNEPADLVTLTNPDNNSIDMTLEVQEGNGSFVPDFKEIRVYTRVYVDQDLIEPVATDDGQEIPEAFVTALDSSIFEISSNGLPRSDVEIETQGILDAYVAAGASSLPVPSFITVRLEIEMTDGRIYTNTDVSVAVGGGTYFVSPYFYRLIFLPI